MQCPFIIQARKPVCETGTFGMIHPRVSEFRNFCSNRSYYLCQIYRGNTGASISEESLKEITARLIEVPASQPVAVNPV